jgi:translation initiation factor IF-3
MARVRRNDRRPPTIEKKPPMNDEIAFSEIRVIAQDKNGKDQPLGVLSKNDALAKAQELGGLDLIVINENSDPPVCKIVDYSKYRYMQEKKAKEVKKNSKATEVKEIKMSYKIDVHDYEVRKKSAVKFLKQGNRVKCSVMFRGREVQHDKLGFELLDRLTAEMEDVCVSEGKPKREGRNLSMIVSPRPEVVKMVNEQRRAEEKAKKKKKAEAKEMKAAEKGVNGSSEEEIDGGTISFASASSDDDDDDDYEDDDDDDDDDDDLLDLEADIESSLDDLFGNDDLSDDLFS